MPKKDSDFVNKSEPHELNYRLKKNGFSESAENRKMLISLLPPNTRSEDADKIIQANKDKFK